MFLSAALDGISDPGPAPRGVRWSESTSPASFLELRFACSRGLHELTAGHLTAPCDPLPGTEALCGIFALVLNIFGAAQTDTLGGLLGNRCFCLASFIGEPTPGSQLREKRDSPASEVWEKRDTRTSEIRGKSAAWF